MHKHTYKQTYWHTYAYTSTCTCTQTLKDLHTNIYTHKTCKYTYMRTYMHNHTHTHTSTKTQVAKSVHVASCAFNREMHHRRFLAVHNPLTNINSSALNVALCFFLLHQNQNTGTPVCHPSLEALAYPPASASTPPHPQQRQPSSTEHPPLPMPPPLRLHPPPALRPKDID